MEQHHAIHHLFSAHAHISLVLLNLALFRLASTIARPSVTPSAVQAIFFLLVLFTSLQLSARFIALQLPVHHWLQEYSSSSTPVIAFSDCQ
jgi:hypothetical protein